MTMLTKHTTG